MRVDPFTIKKIPKWHPSRLAFTAKARWIEWRAKQDFQHYELPRQDIPHLSYSDNVDFSNTDVTPIQMQHLLHALATTEHLAETVVVEVGCYRGVTTRALALATKRQVIAVDPFIGYGGSKEDYHYFQSNIAGLPNVIHERATSGEAAKAWKHQPASLIFIDAVHDYVNTAFDIEVWSLLLVEGGILALHDTDLKQFAGTRKAASEFCTSAELFAHPENLTLFLLKEFAV